ncbi:hypothetical protein GCM10022220_53590 [Actinocatenispora rupis]|uniref:Uncharacterized protein n=1 Tax=Actinocatenispora rupis TaxID=519421 RepID=A0A8J3J0G8_9ACTN|nr:hypothetical protein Aru02nite_01300 [Actinocatenispora rupis]
MTATATASSDSDTTAAPLTDRTPTSDVPTGAVPPPTSRSHRDGSYTLPCAPGSEVVLSPPRAWRRPLRGSR